MVIQGREITHDDIESVRRLVKAHPSWKRTQLSRELCLLWNWRAANGQMKDMACRTFLVKLEQRGYISLPPSQKSPHNALLAGAIITETIFSWPGIGRLLIQAINTRDYPLI